MYVHGVPHVFVDEGILTPWAATNSFKFPLYSVYRTLFCLVNKTEILV